MASRRVRIVRNAIKRNGLRHVDRSRRQIVTSIRSIVDDLV